MPPTRVNLLETINSNETNVHVILAKAGERNYGRMHSLSGPVHCSNIMNMILKSDEIQCRGPKADDGTKSHPCRAFMDGITVMTQFITSTKWILKTLEETANWAHMFFKPEKSHSY